MTLTVEEYVTIEVAEEDVIDYLEERGFEVIYPSDKNYECPFTDEEMDIIAAVFINSQPGTREREIYEKAKYFPK